MDILSQHLRNIKVPTSSDKVYKDECVYSFDTPVRDDSSKLIFLTNCEPMFPYLFLGIGYWFIREPYKFFRVRKRIC